jgi:hypothetical protein
VLWTPFSGHNLNEAHKHVPWLNWLLLGEPNTSTGPPPLFRCMFSLRLEPSFTC